ncbi:uncharacterized protein LOC110918336 [Helianthus annuus]|uniref:uncharacterized protein LOC110918336 n=1 Tax=Helianthus annuus TaxID=4232 RepID=UPI000B90048F|nr:uncharacterized protein LOC110918336 [Helianthus annuus]
MKELAKQELKLLEAQHPTRFNFLKLQLKEFIHLLDQEEEEDQQQQQFYHSPITQESSSSRKRGREEEMDDGYKKRENKIPRRTRQGIRDAIHKAEACLHKIQTLKSFFCSSDH